MPHRHADRSWPPEPDAPLPVPVVDDHTHLASTVERARRLRADQAEGDCSGVEPPMRSWTVGELLAAAGRAGVGRVVDAGWDAASSRAAVAAAHAHPQVAAAVALHPQEVPGMVAAGTFEESFAEVERLAADPRTRAVGESGLDYHWVTDEAGRKAQRESFRRHIALARRTGLALQIHDRLAHDDVLRVLAEEGAPERTVFHSFSGDADMAARCAEAGWYLSFSGTLTFKNAPELREALRAVPAELVLVETDAPFLTPAPYRGRPNASYVMPATVRAQAELRGVSLDDWCRRLARNAEEAYGTW